MSTDIETRVDLMQENQVLRQLLRNLSNFIGDGAGGLLPKLGWDMNDFNNFVNRSETDTAWESYQRHKREEQSTPSAGPSSSQKRPSEDTAEPSRAKRSRGNGGEANAEGDRDYSLLVPVNPAVPPLPTNGLYPSASGSSRHDAGLFSDLMRGPGGSPMFVPPTSPTAQFTGNSSAGGSNPYQSSYMATMNVNVDPALPGMSLVTNPGTMAAPRNPPASAAAPKTHTPTNTADDDQDPKRHEAYKLIQFVANYISCNLRRPDIHSADTISIITSGTQPTAFRRRSGRRSFNGRQTQSFGCVAKSDLTTRKPL